MKHLVEWECSKCGQVHIDFEPKIGRGFFAILKCPVCGSRKIPACTAPLSECLTCEVCKR